LNFLKLNEEYEGEDILILTLKNHKYLNALDHKMLEELQCIIHTVEKKPNVKVLIIKSEIEKAFSTGINTNFVSSLSSEEVIPFFSKLANTLNRIEKLNCITLSVVNGYAYGAGADLAIACDLRIGEHNTKFRFPGPQFGLILGTNRLINEVGKSNARFITMTNKIIDSKSAAKYGLLHSVEDDSKSLFKTVLNIAREISVLPKHSVDSIKNLTNLNEENNNDYNLTKESVSKKSFHENLLKFTKLRRI